MPPFDFTLLYCLGGCIMAIPYLIWLVALVCARRGKRVEFFRRSLAGLVICAVAYAAFVTIAFNAPAYYWFKRHVLRVVGLHFTGAFLLMVLIFGGVLVAITVYALRLSFRSESR